MSQKLIACFAPTKVSWHFVIIRSENDENLKKNNFDSSCTLFGLSGFLLAEKLNLMKSYDYNVEACYFKVKICQATLRSLVC